MLNVDAQRCRSDCCTPASAKQPSRSSMAVAQRRRPCTAPARRDTSAPGTRSKPMRAVDGDTRAPRVTAREQHEPGRAHRHASSLHPPLVAATRHAVIGSISADAEPSPEYDRARATSWTWAPDPTVDRGLPSSSAGRAAMTRYQSFSDRRAAARLRRAPSRWRLREKSSRSSSFWSVGDRGPCGWRLPPFCLCC